MSATGSTFVPDPAWPTIVELAIERWGQPNKRLSKPDDLRFGAKGSKSVKPSANTWHDHESSEGGGYVDIWKLARPREQLPRRPDKPHHGNGKAGNGKVPPWEDIARVYDYTDEEGNLILQVVRTLSGAPRFVQRQPVRNGKWKWSVKDLPGHDCLLYRLPSLRSSGETTVWITEGEKDADRLHDEGVIATTNIGGAGKWRDEYVEEFRGKPVVILQDNDKAGRDHAHAVARSLIGIAASVKVLLLPGLSEKGDVSDWLDRGGAVEELERLALEAPEFRRDGATPGLPRPMSLAAFLASATLPEFLIEPLLQRGYLYTLTARTFHGKTSLLILLALCVATGRRFADLFTQQGRVVLFAGENPDDTAQKLRVACDYWGLDPAKLPISVIPGAFDLSGNIDDALAMAAEGGPLALCGIDTSTAYRFDDDEDDNPLSKLWAQQLRRFTELPGKPAVVVPTHPTKHAERDGLLPRGGGAFLGEVDGNLTLWADLDAGTTELHWLGKQRGPSFAPIRFDLHKHPHPEWKFHDGQPVPMAVAVPSTSVITTGGTARKLTGDRGRAYELLCNLIITDGVLGITGVPAGIRSVSANAWRDVFYDGAKATASTEAKKKAFQRVCDDLVNPPLRMVGLHFGRVWLADRCEGSDVPFPDKTGTSAGHSEGGDLSESGTSASGGGL